MKPTAIFFFLILLFSPLAYAVDYAEQQENLRLMDRLERIERNLGMLQQQVYNGGGAAKSAIENKDIASGSEQNGSSLARIDARIGEIEEQIRTLTGKVEQADFNNTKLAEKLDKLAADHEYRFGELEKKAGISTALPGENPDNSTETPEENAAGKEPAAPKNEENNDTAAPPIAAKQPLKEPVADEEASTANPKDMTPQEQYQHAFGVLRANKYPEAEQLFKQFIADNKKSPLAGSAYYWLGETYYTQGKYDKGAIEFLHSYKGFPKGKKAPESLLKLAQSLGKLKKRKEACTTLGTLNEEFPAASSAVKQKSKEVAASLGCK